MALAATAVSYVVEFSSFCRVNGGTRKSPAHSFMIELGCGKNRSISKVKEVRLI